MAQDLGAGELGGRRALGERGRRLLEVDPVELDPRPRERTSGRASAASRAMSAAVSSTSSNTADQRTLLSWWAPTTDVAGRLGEQAQRRRRLAARQRRHPHVEAGGRERGAGDGHQLPRLVLAQAHLAAALRRRRG